MNQTNKVIFDQINTLKTFTKAKASCSGTMIIKSRFLIVSRNISNPIDCLVFCFFSNKQEVAQLVMSSGDNNLIECRCSNLKSQYLLLFPGRYIECVNRSTNNNATNSINMTTKIIYRSDRVWTNLTNIQKPSLFYTLDDVTGIVNMGKLDPTVYSPTWRSGGPGHFDCPWNVASPNPSSSKYLRIVPSESPILQIIHNLSLSVSKGFTMMLWFKKRVPSLGAMPLIDTSLGDNDIDFHMWIYPSSTQLYWNARALGYSYDNKFDLNSWNHYAVSVGPTSVTVVLNGTILDVMSKTLNIKNDRLTIGRRMFTTNCWDGWLAHVMVFERQVAVEEIQIWMRLIMDVWF